MKTESWNITSKSPASALAVLKAIAPSVPKAAVVLGSGVNVLMDLHGAKTVPFEEVFGIAPSVAGHAGSITIGRLEESAHSPLVAVVRGRYHLYEGHSWSTVTLPTEVFVEWGVPHLVLTNAAGGLNKTFQVGDLMVISSYRDMLNPKFRDDGLVAAVMEEPTNSSNAFALNILSVGEQLHKADPAFTALRKGTYAALLGPSYETLAEIEMLRRLDADAVGMSTVPELLTAKGTGTEAAAISVITNVWRDDEQMGGHTEVLEASKQASLRLDELLATVLSKLC